MATTVKAIYKGDLRTAATHLQSGVEVNMDAPTDNHGKGESFSPTDLVATALGGCMATIIAISAQTHGFDVTGTTMEITKVMAADPRRISEIRVEFTFPRDYDDKTKKIIELAASQCPVAQSLHPDLFQNVIFNYGK